MSDHAAGISPEELQRIAGQAETQWRKREDPRWKTTKFQATDQDGNAVPLKVEFYHHETFPMGGQLYTLDVRRADTGQLLHQDRLSLDPLG